MFSNPYVGARTGEESREAQERNRAWWERLPMTYEAWEAKDRSTDRERIVGRFLDGNPWLTRDYFAQFRGKDVLVLAPVRIRA